MKFGFLAFAVASTLVTTAIASADYRDDRRDDRGGDHRGRPSAPPGSYRQTCQRIQFDGNVIRAVCETATGAWVNTSLDIRYCTNGDISNMNGQLDCPRR